MKERFITATAGVILLFLNAGAQAQDAFVPDRTVLPIAKPTYPPR